MHVIQALSYFYDAYFLNNCFILCLSFVFHFLNLNLSRVIKCNVLLLNYIITITVSIEKLWNLLYFCLYNDYAHHKMLHLLNGPPLQAAASYLSLRYKLPSKDMGGLYRHFVGKKSSQRKTSMAWFSKKSHKPKNFLEQNILLILILLN